MYYYSCHIAENWSAGRLKANEHLIWWFYACNEDHQGAKACRTDPPRVDQRGARRTPAAPRCSPHVSHGPVPYERASHGACISWGVHLMSVHLMGHASH